MITIVIVVRTPFATVSLFKIQCPYGFDAKGLVPHFKSSHMTILKGNF